MKKLFGTDGIRGEAGEFPLDEPTVRRIARSLSVQFTDRLGRTPRLLTGRDTRESGSWIEEAFHTGATAAGATVESAGVITTPGVAYIASAFDFDAGVVISASHNPYEDNGIKIFAPDGKKIDPETERLIEQDIFSPSWEDETGATLESVDARNSEKYRNAYLSHLKDVIPDLRLNETVMVVDCANGASSRLAPQLFEDLGAEVIAINDRPDGKNINRDCGSLHLESLAEKVLDREADFGVAFDGDADRALFVDEKGEVVDGDATLWIMARSLIDNGGLQNRTVVATLMSNIGLELALNGSGIKLVRTAVGDKYVLDELLKSGSDLGGEQSGHVIFPRQSLVGDGMMTTLFVLNAIRSAGKSFSEMTAGFTRYPQILVNVPVKDKRPFDDVAAIYDASKSVEDELSGNGRLLLRYSGTENLARVMIEGKDQIQIERQANELAEVIRKSLG